MAEERIIDDDLDKDKKYRVITGEDGEDELIINEVEEPEEITLETDEELVDDEEMGVLTAEQYEAAMILKAEEDARREKELKELRERVKACMDNNQFSDALDCVESSEEFELEDGEFTCIKLEALTQKFTDFSEKKAITSAVKQVSEEASAENRARLYETYNSRIETLRSENAAKLKEVNERYAVEQQSRREVLAPRKKKALINFIIALSVFAVFLVAAIVCSTMMFSMQNGVMLVITIVLAVIAVIALAALIFVTRTFVSAARMSAANEKDKSTKLGRERASLVSYGETLKAISMAIAPETSETKTENAAEEK